MSKTNSDGNEQAAGQEQGPQVDLPGQLYLDENWTEDPDGVEQPGQEDPEEADPEEQKPAMPEDATPEQLRSLVEQQDRAIGVLQQRLDEREHDVRELQEALKAMRDPEGYRALQEQRQVWAKMELEHNRALLVWVKGVLDSSHWLRLGEPVRDRLEQWVAEQFE